MFQCVFSGRGSNARLSQYSKTNCKMICTQPIVNLLLPYVFIVNIYNNIYKIHKFIYFIFIVIFKL